eukprot:373766-Amphidinium_carterae.2
MTDHVKIATVVNNLKGTMGCGGFDRFWGSHMLAHDHLWDWSPLRAPQADDSAQKPRSIVAVLVKITSQ